MPVLQQVGPIIQQAQVDYASNPVPADTLIAKLVSKYNDGWDYTASAATFAAKAQLKDGIIANGPTASWAILTWPVSRAL